MQELTTLINLFEDYFEFGEAYSNKEIKNFFEKNEIGKNSQHPGSFTYNLSNDGTSYFLPLFEHVGHNQYIYRGPNYTYNGELIHRSKGQKEYIHVGTWNNGKLKLHGPETNLLSKADIENRIREINAYGVNKALQRLVEAKSELRRLDAVRSERLTGEIGEWYAEMITGAKRANATSQSGWDLELNDKKIQVKTHAKGEDNNARWTDWKYTEKVFDELLILVLTSSYKIKEVYRMTYEEASSRINRDNKSSVLNWDNYKDYLLNEVPDIVKIFLDS